MKSKEQIFAGVYSFCFPGLGQLFNSRPFVSLFFLSLFIYCEYNPKYQSLLPIGALFSSLEAFVRFRVNKEVKPVKIYLYASVATLSLIYWMFLFGGIFFAQLLF